MNLNPETIAQIQTLLKADPALLAQLQAQTELAGVAAVIAKAAAAQGLNLSEATLMSFLTVEQSQTTAAAMSDAELEQVAGGGIGAGIFGSILGLGIGCAALSIHSAVTGKNCGKVLGSFELLDLA